MAQPSNVYDQDADEHPVHHNLPAGDPSGPRDSYDPQTAPLGDSSDPRNDLQSAEKDGGLYNPTGDKSTLMGAGALSAAEGTEGSSGLYNRAAGTIGLGGRLKGALRIRNKRRAYIGGGAVGVLIGGAFAFFSVVSGPLQFVHFAQLLQQFHFRSNEDFGDDRTSKVLLYSLIGTGAERGRLGITGNHAADKWEQKLLKDTGLRPVYSETTRRFVGFEIVDENKAFNALDVSSGKNRAGVEQAMGKGAEIRTAGEASAGKQRIVRGGSGGVLDSKTRIIDMSSVKSYAERAKFIRTIGRLTSTSKISSSIGSRLLIKRAGVDFHPLKNLKRKAGDTLADYRQRVRDDNAKEEETGKLTEVDHASGQNQNGQPNETPETAQATNDANSAIDEAASGVGRDAVKEVVKKIGKGGAALGVLCAAKSLGNDIPKYKYENDALPMMRMGMSAVTAGNQVMSNQGVNIDELGALSQSFYNPTDKTSWTNAKSVQAELGQTQNGKDLPPEARLSNVTDKPAFFDALDSLPFLGTACSVSGLASSLPIIGSVIDLGSQAAVGALNGVVGVFGTSVDDIMTSALAAVAGKSVDTLATGADYGNLANTGAFLAANDNAVSMGGAPLSSNQVAQIKTEEQVADVQAASKESFSQRYLDPYDDHTLVASLIDKVPTSSSQVASTLSGTLNTFSSSLSSLANIFTGRARAVTSGYDYGVPKYGFSAADRDNPEFEDPYENAQVIEQPGVLDQLNQKYGKTCFGMTVTATDSGVQVQSDSMGSDNVNIFKIQKDHPECDPKNNNDPMFLRYRFYLADSVTAESLNCYEDGDGSDQSCSDMGISSNTNSTDSSAGDASQAASGDAQQLAKQILSNESIDLTCLSSSVQQDVQDAADGKVGTAGVSTSAAVLQLIATIGQSHKVCVTAIQSNGQGHASGSYHYSGDAVDFGSLDGAAITGRNAPAITILKQAFSILPSGTGLGQSQCGATPTLPSGWTTFNDTCNHLHIQVPRGTK